MKIHAWKNKTNNESLFRWSFLIGAFLSLLFYFSIWPLVWHLIILPKSQPTLHGFRSEPGQEATPNSSEPHFFPGSFFRLDQPNSSLFAYAIWTVSQKGFYKIRLTCDDNGQVAVDNRRIILLEGIHASIEGEGGIRLSRGTHFLAVRLNNVVEKGWMKIEVVRPNHIDYQPINIKEINFIKLGNMETWLQLVYRVKIVCLFAFLLCLSLGQPYLYKKYAQRLPIKTMFISTFFIFLVVFIIPKTFFSGFWAFFFYDDFSFWLKIGFLITPLLLTLYIYHFSSDWLNNSLNKDNSPRMRHCLFLSALLLGSFCVFWYFREIRFWGDGQTTIKIFDYQGIYHTKPIGEYFWKEPLDRLLVILCYKIFHQFWNWGAADVIALLSCLGGCFFIVTLWDLSGVLSTDRYEFFFIFFFTLSMGASQLFFGHVENYTLVTLFMLLYMLSALKFLKGGWPFYIPTLLASIAVMVHPLASFLFPSLLMLLYHKIKIVSWRKIHLILIDFIPGIILPVIFYVYCRQLGAPPFLLSFNNYNGNQIFLSISEALKFDHLWDVFQNCILILPLGVFILIFILMMDLIKIKRLQFQGETTLFLFLMASSYFIYLIFFCSRLNRLMDWDLFAPSALPLTLLLAHLFINIGKKENAKILGIYSILYSFSFTIPWILSNLLNIQNPL